MRNKFYDIYERFIPGYYIGLSGMFVGGTLCCYCMLSYKVVPMLISSALTIVSSLISYWNMRKTGKEIRKELGMDEDKFE